MLAVDEDGLIVGSVGDLDGEIGHEAIIADLGSKELDVIGAQWAISGISDKELFSHAWGDEFKGSGRVEVHRTQTLSAPVLARQVWGVD